LQKQIEDFQRREKKMEETQRETKVMLDVYQSESKEKRDVTEVSGSSQPLRDDISLKLFSILDTTGRTACD